MIFIYYKFFGIFSSTYVKKFEEMILIIRDPVQLLAELQ